VAAAKNSPSVSVRHDVEGDMYQLGFKLEGVFVPVAQVSGDFARALAGSPASSPEPGDDQEGGS
jgi:hypothetical protein